MAVYTHLTKENINLLLEEYSIGKLISFRPITAGVENTNYFIDTDQDTFVLTIYEKRVEQQALPFYLGLMKHLHDKGAPVPNPLTNKSEKLYSTILGKSCAIISFLEGKSAHQIQNDHLAELGQHMAKLHLLSSDFSHSMTNRFSLPSWEGLFLQTKDKADQLKKGLSNEIEEHLQFLKTHWPQNLPTGIIHGDLFPDNVFFKNNHLSGMIDFYFACTDFWMYDIAICLNAWCFEVGGDFNVTKARLLLTNYHKVRPISEEELNALPILASGAAMRFLLTRLYDWLYPATGAVVTPKNPLEYLQRLRFHQHITSHSEYGL